MNDLKNNDSPAIIPQNSAMSVGEFINYSDQTSLLNYATMLWASQLNQFDKPEDVVTVLIWAHERGVPKVDALSHTMVVNKKLGIDSHMARGFIDQAGILHETLEDHRPVYRYTAHDKMVYSEDDILKQPDNFEIYLSADLIKDHAINKKIVNGVINGRLAVLRSADPVDYRTIIRFTRWINTPDGIFKKIEYGHFLLSEAENAGLLTKSNWMNWETDCMYSRAFMRGARRVGDDYLLGLYSKLELADEANIDIPLTQEEL